MSEEKGKRVYCTNMQDDDPIIERFMKEYLQEKAGAKQEGKTEDIVVNFDISYPDGRCETHTCGSESYVFGENDDSCINSKIEAEEMKCYYSDADINVTEKEYDESEDDHICNDCKEEESVKQEPCNVNTSEYYEEYESQKWLNCEDEWTENNNCGYSVKDKKDKCKKEVKGVITVISALHSKEGTKIKGVKVNLYKLNGICPELVDSKVTDCDGKVVFCNIPEGAYRVIELIDKRYFEKPQYINWNEVTIDECTTESCIYIINKIKNQRKCRR